MTFLLNPVLLSLCLSLAACGATSQAGPGTREARFAPCPNSPNCVSSLATDARHNVVPLDLGEYSVEQALARLEALLSGQPRITLVQREPQGYLRAEVRSRVFAFVDDLELQIDPAHAVIHVRSASRTGRYDFGVNRKRVEALSEAFAKVL